MKFILIDKVLDLDSGKSIQTVKAVSLAEEYLGDHFPMFPVLPGVLLLQGMIESASWLVRESQQFSCSMVLLKQAKNVKYKSFLRPGEKITYSVNVKKLEQDQSSFIGYGESGSQRIVDARFTLCHFNLADKNKAYAYADADLIKSLKKRWKILR